MKIDEIFRKDQVRFGSEEIRKNKVESTILDFREGEEILGELEMEKDKEKMLFTMMDDNHSRITTNEDNKRENRFFTSKETENLNKIRSHSYKSNKIGEGSIESYENNFSEIPSYHVYNNEYSNYECRDLSRRDNKSTQRDNEKEYTRIQPTSSRLFVNNSNENKRYYYSEFNHTQSSNYKNFCSRQIYDGINQDLKYRRHSFTGNDTTPIMHLKLSELQPKVVDIMPENICANNTNNSIEEDTNKENIKFCSNQSPSNQNQLK